MHLECTRILIGCIRDHLEDESASLSVIFAHDYPFLQISETTTLTVTEQAIGKACDLLDYYNLLKEGGNFNNSTILHVFLEQNVLDACTYWVKC